MYSILICYFIYNASCFKYFLLYVAIRFQSVILSIMHPVSINIFSYMYSILIILICYFIYNASCFNKYFLL